MRMIYNSCIICKNNCCLCHFIIPPIKFTQTHINFSIFSFSLRRKRTWIKFFSLLHSKKKNRKLLITWQLPVPFNRSLFGGLGFSYDGFVCELCPSLEQHIPH